MGLQSALDLHVWGENWSGELGLGDDDKYFGWVTNPTRINVPDTTWVQIACGPWHTAAISSNGELFTWGCGNSGKLGHGDRWSRSVPTKVKIPGGPAVVKVACGRDHTAVVTRTGKLFTWYVSC